MDSEETLYLSKIEIDAFSNMKSRALWANIQRSISKHDFIAIEPQMNELIDILQENAFHTGYALGKQQIHS